jgi:hypothetical protein
VVGDRDDVFELAQVHVEGGRVLGDAYHFRRRYVIVTNGCRGVG